MRQMVGRGSPNTYHLQGLCWLHHDIKTKQKALLKAPRRTFVLVSMMTNDDVGWYGQYACDTTGGLFRWFPLLDNLGGKRRKGGLNTGGPRYIKKGANANVRRDTEGRAFTSSIIPRQEWENSGIHYEKAEWGGERGQQEAEIKHTSDQSHYRARSDMKYIWRGLW